MVSTQKGEIWVLLETAIELTPVTTQLEKFEKTW